MMAPSLLILVVLAISFISSFLLTPVVQRITVFLGVVDWPSVRKIHKSPVPRLGGIALYLSFLVSCLFFARLDTAMIGILIGSTCIVITGILDDIIGISPWAKLTSQIFSALVTIHFGVKIAFITNPFGGVISFGWLALPITLFWIVGIINTLNLIDGLDGLAAGISGISASVLALVAFANGQTLAGILAVTVVGSCLGFLKYNFSPANIFMGDSGSMLLGYLLSTISILGMVKSTVAISFVIPIFILGIPISDTLYAIFRRLRNKQGVFNPDLAHFHHLLLDLGLTQRQVVVLIYLGNIMLGCYALGLSFITSFAGSVVLTVSFAAITALLYMFRRKYAVIFSLFPFI